jgi:DNA-binding IclR family transcriptional regulator
MRCIAAPVRDDTGNVSAAVGIAGPVQRLTKKRLLSLAPMLINAVNAISQRLGDRPSLPPRRTA